MAKDVVRWPMKLTPAGVTATDSSWSSGMRMAVRTTKKTALGRPDKGLSSTSFEQGGLDQDAEMVLRLTSLFSELTGFVPSINILEIKQVKDTDNKRNLIEVRYVASADPKGINVFRFDLPNVL